MSRKEVPRAGLVKAALAGQVTNAQEALALHLTSGSSNALRSGSGPRGLVDCSIASAAGPPPAAARLVLGRLAAEGVVKMQFGASQVTRDRESKALVSLGDDLKAAATDALKKCATFLGVGLHLYAAKPLRFAPPATAPPPKSKDVPAAGKATPRQLDAIWKVGKAKGLDREEVERLSLRGFGKKPEALTEAEAAALIKELSNLRRKAA